MNLQFSWIIIPSAVAGIIGLISAWLLWNRRSARGALPLAVLFLVVSVWSISYLIELAVVSYQASSTWLKIQYLGIVCVPVIWLLFCLRYANIRLPRISTFILILSVIPLITLGLVFTNGDHHLIWSRLSFINRYDINLLALNYGSWFWVHSLYSFLLYLGGLYFLIQHYFKTPRILRSQIHWIFLAAIIPAAANYLYITNNNPIEFIDLTALSFAISGPIMVFVIYYPRFLDIVPIARDTTIEFLQDGIVVVDLRDQIVDINPAGEKIIRASYSEVAGKQPSQILADLANWSTLPKEMETPVLLIQTGEGQAKEIHSLTTHPLSDGQGELIGHTIVFHNITESQKLQQDLRNQADRLAVLYEIGKAITSTLEIDTLLELIYEQLSKVLPSDAYFVALYLPEDHKLDIRILIDKGKRFPGEIVDANQGLSSWIVNNRKPLLINDLRKDLENLDAKPIMVGEKRLSRSWLGVPMQIDQDLIGLLAITNYSPNMYTLADQLLLEQIAQQAVLSIKNARNYLEATRQANLDSLTGVSNHKHLIEILYKETAAALPSLTPLSMIMLDIDHFKIYNDTYGHMIGDQVLRLTVQAIQSHIKKIDTVGRWGGEEFGIVLPNTTTDQAKLVANRIRKTLAELPLFNVEGKTIPKPTISQGIANMPEHTTDADELVIIADRALYRAKEKGRDQIAVGIRPPS